MQIWDLSDKSELQSKLALLSICVLTHITVATSVMRRKVMSTSSRAIHSLFTMALELDCPVFVVFLWFVLFLFLLAESVVRYSNRCAETCSFYCIYSLHQFGTISRLGEQFTLHLRVFDRSCRKRTLETPPSHPPPTALVAPACHPLSLPPPPPPVANLLTESRRTS